MCVHKSKKAPIFEMKIFNNLVATQNPPILLLTKLPKQTSQEVELLPRNKKTKVNQIVF